MQGGPCAASTDSLIAGCDAARLRKRAQLDPASEMVHITGGHAPYSGDSAPNSSNPTPVHLKLKVQVHGNNCIA